MKINTEEIKMEESKTDNKKIMYKMEIRVKDKTTNKINVHNIEFADKLLFVKQTKEKTKWFKTANDDTDCYLKMIPQNFTTHHTQYLKLPNDDAIEGMEQLVPYVTVKMPQNNKLCYIFRNKTGTKIYYFM